MNRLFVGAQENKRVQPSSTTRRSVTLIKWGVGVVLLAALLIWNGNGAKAVAHFSSLRAQHVFVLVALSFAMNWVSAVKWGAILRSRGTNLSISRLTSLYLVGKFFSNFLPSMIGGDVARILLLGRQIGSNAQATASVLIERFTGLIAVASLTILAVAARPTLVQEPLVAATVIAAAAVLLAGGALLMTTRIPNVIELWLARSKRLAAIAGKLQTLHRELHAFEPRDRIFIVALAYSVTFYAVATVSLYMSLRVVGAEVSYLDVALFTPIIFLLTAIPVSINNIGWWEWCVSILLLQSGAEMSQGVAAAITMRAATLCVSLVGGLLFLLGAGASVREPGDPLSRR